MATKTSAPLGRYGDRAAQRFVLGLGLYAFLAGLLAFSGWVFDVQPLTDWDGNGISIQPNASLAATCAGAALVFLALGRKRVAVPLSITVAFIGWATAFEYLSGIVLGIDGLFLFGREWGRVGVIVPGRMGPPGTVSWCLVGAALLCCLGSSRYRRFVPIMAALVVAIASLSLLGYLYGADKLYTLPRLTVIASQTATMLLAVSCGLLGLVPERAPMRTFLNKGAAGTLARRTLPFLIGLPAILGFIGLRGQQQRLYDTATGTALLVLVLTAMICVVMWWGVRTISAHEARLAADAFELQQHASALRLTQERLQRSLSAARMVAWEWNAIEDRSVATDNLADLYGLAAGSSVASSQEGFPLYPDDAAQHRSLVERAVAEHGSYVSRFRIIRPNDQQLMWLEERAQVASDDGDNALRICGVTQDITDHKTAEEALMAVDRQKDEFLAILAHELRNPLGPIRNAAQILMFKRTADPDSVRPLEIINRQIEHMTRLIDDLLDVSRMSQGKLELRLERIEFSEIALAAVETCAGELEARGHVLRLDLPHEPVPLEADRDRLIQVLSNLVSNASKYTQVNGLIEITASIEGGQLVTTVKDNGQGIPRDKLTEIFELFAQVDRSLERQGGLGIGLTLARDLVELHGGTIKAHSEGLGRGSAFTIRLQISTAPPAASREPVDDALVAAVPQRVLVADDNRDGAECLAVLLRIAGHDVRLAFDGAEAFAEVKEFQPRVAILDIGMPMLNGYDLARRIRQESWGDRIHLVALTGWGQDADRAQAADAGFDEHMVKPVAPEVINAMLVRIGAASALSDNDGSRTLS